MSFGSARRIACVALAAVIVLPLAAAAQTPPAQPPAPSSPTPASQPALPPIPPVPPVPSVGGGAPLTLRDAVRRALADNLQVRQAAIQVALAREQVAQTKAGLLPTANLSTSYTQQTAGGAGTFSVPSAGITGAPFVSGSQTSAWISRLVFGYPLYTGNALQDQVAIAQANLRGQESAFAATAGQIVLAVRQAYYNLEQSEGQVAAAQRAVDASRENVRVTQVRVRVGTSPQFDLLQAEVQLAQAQQTLTRAKAAAVLAEQQLAAVLHVPISSQINTATPMGLPAPAPDVEALVAQALVTRPELAQAQATVQADQAAVDLAAAGLRPNISVTGGPSLSTNSSSVNSSVSWSGTIQMTLAVFDGGLTRAKVGQARQQLALARSQEEQTRQTVEEQVRSSYLNLQQAAEQLASARAGLTAAQEALRIANVRFQAGVGTQLEVVTAVQNLAAADAAVVQAMFQYNLALAQIDQAVGLKITSP